MNREQQEQRERHEQGEKRPYKPSRVSRLRIYKIYKGHSLFDLQRTLLFSSRRGSPEFLLSSLIEGSSRRGFPIKRGKKAFFTPSSHKFFPPVYFFMDSGKLLEVHDFTNNLWGRCLPSLRLGEPRRGKKGGAR